MGMMKVQGFYLPWIYVAMDLVMGANPVESLLGIFVGHLYYFFGTLHPMRTGKNFLGTPLWFRNMVENGTSTSRSYSRPGWQGRGRRLSD